MDEPILATPRRSIEANIGARRSSSRLQSLSKTTYTTSDRSLSRTPQIPSAKTTPTPQAPRSPKDDSPVPLRSLRKRKSSVNNISTDPIADALKPLTAEERFNWKGWVELESDPVSNPLILIWLVKLIHIRYFSITFYDNTESRMLKFKRFSVLMTNH